MISLIKKYFKGDVRLFINYVIIAVIATAFDFLVLYSLTEFLGIWYFYSSMVSYVTASIPHYTLNKYLNFKNKNKKVFSQYGIFLSISLVGLILTQLLLYVFVESFNIWYIFAKVLTVLIVMFWNFFANKKITFNVLQ